MAERIVVSALGDSITAGSPRWDPNPEVRAKIGRPDPASQYGHWASRADPRLEFRNCGVYGERTDEIARRLASCSDRAIVLVVQGGINDIAQRHSVDGAADNLRAMVRQGQAQGLVVLIADVLPWNNGYPDAERPIRRLNDLITAIAAEDGIVRLAFHAALEDTERPGRMPEAWTSDGDHPSVEGYRRLGELAAARIGEALSFRTASSSSS